MTIVADPAAPSVVGAPRTGPAAAPARRGLLPEAWPVYVALFGYGITWLLGFGEYIFVVLAVPMGASLARRRRISTPPAFGVWLVFLLWMIASGYMAGQRAVYIGEVGHHNHFGSWANRALIYLSATVVLLFVQNTSTRALPTRTVVRGLGAMFLLTVAGGYLGLLFPHLSFSTPLGAVAPHGVQSFLKDSLHPAVAEYQGILGYSVSRPSAPFYYTNSWGGNLSLFLPFFVLGWFGRGASPLRRLLGAGVLVVAMVPIVYSLNRGLWVNIGVAAVVASMFFARRGNLRPLVLLLVAGLTVALVVLASPLHSIISDRLSHGHSNERRAGLAQQAFEGALHSPILGWGTTRDSLGSNNSIAVGGSTSCPSCGTPPIGTHGHLYLLIFAQGFPGAALWFAFFGATLWRYRRSSSPLVLTARINLCVLLFMTLYYNALAAPQFYAMMVIGLLARDEAAARSAPQEGRSLAAAPVTSPVSAPPAAAGKA